MHTCLQRRNYHGDRRGSVPPPTFELEDKYVIGPPNRWQLSCKNVAHAVMKLIHELQQSTLTLQTDRRT